MRFALRVLICVTGVVACTGCGQGRDDQKPGDGSKTAASTDRSVTCDQGQAKAAVDRVIARNLNGASQARLEGGASWTSQGDCAWLVEGEAGWTDPINPEPQYMSMSVLVARTSDGSFRTDNFLWRGR